MSARRFDSAKLGKVEKTGNGFIRVPANLTRVGVLEYRDSSGNITRELRHPDHVFAPESLATLQGIPVTELHPGAFVNPDNVAQLQVGFVSETPKQDGRFVSSKLTIQRKDSIDKVLRRDLAEVSMGYTCVPVPEKGVWNGQPYDVVQTQIKYDHAAIGPRGWGRAGSDVALRLDSNTAFATCPENELESEEMELQERLDAAEAKIKQLETDLGKAQAEAAAVNAALETYKAAERKDARDALESQARKILGDEAKFEGQTDRQVREAAILKIQPEQKLDGLSDDFVAGAFAYLSKGVPTGRNDSLAALHTAVASPNTDAPKTPAQIREDALAKKHKLWLSEETK